MLKNKKTMLSLVVTLVMTIAVIVLRMTLVPWAQGRDGFNLGYIVVGLMVLTIVALFVLLHTTKRELPELPAVKGRWLLPLSVTVIAVGACVLVTTLMEMYVWSAYGVTPAPGTAVTSEVDRITLFASMILGVLSGIYFIRLGVMWIREDGEIRGAFPVWALMPTFWIWMRLARYEVSYASAVQVHESFYDFSMLILSMLFLLALARQTVDVSAKKSYKTMFYALCTAFLSISGSLARVFLFLSGEGEISRTGQLAGLPDFAIGVLAIAFVLYWMFVDQDELRALEEAEAEESILESLESETDAADEPSLEAVPEEITEEV